MSKVDRFQDLIAWQKARQLVKEVYLATREKPFSSDWGLSQQIQRAAVSIMSNIAEGYERGGPAEFHQFLFLAKGSCAEVRSQLVVALDIGYLNTDHYERLQTMAEEVGRIIGGLRLAVKRQRDEH